MRVTNSWVRGGKEGGGDGINRVEMNVRMREYRGC